jgi:hypothetical protein
MMLPPKVSRSTMAAQSRASVNVLVQPEKESLEAMATEFFSLSFGQNLEKEFRTTLVEFHVAKLVDAQKINSPVTADGPGQDLVVSCLHQLVHQSYETNRPTVKCAG